MDYDKIVPCLWFHTEGGNVDIINKYYQEIFREDYIPGKVVSLGNTPSGKTEICQVFIYGKKYNFMSTATSHNTFNDSVAFAINCEYQAEIDRIWNYLTQEGREMQCGWCIDKFGLRWQVIPKNLDKLMSKPNSFEVMMKQKKIIIEDYEK